MGASSVNLRTSKFVQKCRPPKLRNVFLDADITFDESVIQRDAVYKHCQVIYTILRCMGVFPYSRPSPRATTFKLRSREMGYSVAVFLALTCYVIYVAVNRIDDVSSLEGPFEETVIAYLFLINLLPILVIPIVWCEIRSMVKVLNDWTDYEMMYFKVTKRPLPLQVTTKSTLIAIALTICSSVSVVLTHVTLGHFMLSQVIPYCYIDTLTYMLGAYWCLACETLSSSAFILANDLKKALRNIGPAARVSDYRALWLRLSKLTRDTGTSTCCTFTFISLYSFAIITLSIYGLMSQLSDGFGIKDVGLLVTAFCNIFLMFCMCNAAHYATHNVTTNFQKKLLMIKLSWTNADAYMEIKMFLRGTEMNPASINLGGYFDVDRKMFKSLLATMVTYLVVLLQFQVSLPEEPGASETGVELNETSTIAVEQ